MQTILIYILKFANLCYPAIVPAVILIFAFLLRGKPKINFFLIGIFLTLLAYYFVPTVDDDLYRYWQLLDLYRSRGIEQLTSVYLTNYYYNTSLLLQLLLYFLSKLPNWCTPVFGTVSTYLMIGILDFRFFRDYNTSPRIQSILIAFQILTIEIYSLISSWLYFFTLAIIANIMYTDLVKKKRQILCIIAYVLLGQLHTISYVFFAFRVLAIFLPKQGLRYIPFVLMIWRLFVDALIAVLSLFSSNPFIQRIVENAIKYSNYTENSNVIYMVALALLALTATISIHRCEALMTKNNENSPLHLFFVLKCCAFLIIGSFGSQNLMFRFSHFLSIMHPFHIGAIINRENSNRPITKISPLIFTYFLAVVILNIYYVWVSHRLLI